MKKVTKSMIISLSGVLLIGCTQHKENNEPVSKVHESMSVSKKPKVSIEHAKTQEVVSKKKLKEDVIDYDVVYKDILNRYAHYMKLKNEGNLKKYLEAIKTAEKKENFMLMNFYESPSDFLMKYDYVDINHDGKKELIIGNEGIIFAIYYLTDDIASMGNNYPQFAVAGGVAATRGGTRISLNIYQDGTIIVTNIPGVNVESYQLTSHKLEKQREETIENYDEDSIKAAVGVTALQVDLSQFTWKSLPEVKDVGATDIQSTTMNIDAISEGDFSSIAGTWQRSTGQKITFDNNGTLNEGQHVALDISNIKTNGFLESSMAPNNPAPGSQGLTFIPAGVKFHPYATFMKHMDETEAQEKIDSFIDPSDITKDRIWMGQRIPLGDNEFYYKVD